MPSGQNIGKYRVLIFVQKLYFLFCIGGLSARKLDILVILFLLVARGVGGQGQELVILPDIGVVEKVTVSADELCFLLCCNYLVIMIITKSKKYIFFISL
jgi:hypothetical protein